LATNYFYGVQSLVLFLPIDIFEPFDPHDKNVKTRHDVFSTKTKNNNDIKIYIKINDCYQEHIILFANVPANGFYHQTIVQLTLM